MKKLIYTVGLILCSVNVFAQNKESFLDEAKKDFAKLYYSIPFGKDFNWFERFCEANAAFYSLHSKFVVKHFSDLKRAKAYKYEDELIAAVADSINTWFLQNHAQDSVPNWYGQLNGLLPLITEKVCDCIYKTKQTDTIVKIDEGVTKCFSAFMADTALVTKFQSVFKGKPMNEMLFASQLTSQHVMIHCKPLYIFSKNTGNNMATEQFASSIGFFRAKAMKKIIHYSSNKNFDSLSALFPKYKKFESEIVALKNNRADFDYTRTSASSDETISYTYTFFKTHNKKAVVTSQVMIGFDASRLDVVVSKLQFIERNKIKGLSKIEEGLNEAGELIPPPPMSLPPKKQ